MRKSITAVVVAVTLAAATIGNPRPAQARCWGCWVGAGLAVGIIGSAIIASSRAYAYGYPGYYGYGYAPYAYAPAYAYAPVFYGGYAPAYYGGRYYAPRRVYAPGVYRARVVAPRLYRAGVVAPRVHAGRRAVAHRAHVRRHR
jgi:hypothetical protein